MPVAEDGIVDDYAVDGGVVVRFDKAVLEEFAVDLAEVECEATSTC